MTQGAQVSAQPAPSGIFEASLGPNGAVVRGNKLTIKEAEEYRKKGYNVVVCGPNVQSNRNRAKAIETNANGSAVHHGASPTAGANALHHFQPDPRPPQGHSFYESNGRSAQ